MVPARMRAPLLILIGICTCIGAKAQTPTFRADTQLVPIYATVMGDDDRLVTDLVAEDFDVLDDGKPQKLALFENSVQPMTVVVMLDTSASMTLALKRLGAAAEQFVIRLLPQIPEPARVCSTIAFSSVPNSRPIGMPLSTTSARWSMGNGTGWYDGLATSLDQLKSIEGRKVILGVLRR